VQFPEPTPDEQNRPVVQHEEQARDLAADILLQQEYAKMLEMPAWKDLDNHLALLWEQAEKALHAAKEMTDVIRAQEAIKAVQSIWDRVKAVHLAAAAARQYVPGGQT
jgi:hypothetical protein